ncbi:hypothetical protein Xcab_04009 [Xenorhabdus cabanillasii JM26]|nr:hypothetical protein Xcab_04009 [Xenorhabdus cabanillasii JM26]
MPHEKSQRNNGRILRVINQDIIYQLECLGKQAEQSPHTDQAPDRCNGSQSKMVRLAFHFDWCTIIANEIHHGLVMAVITDNYLIRGEAGTDQNFVMLTT